MIKAEKMIEMIIFGNRSKHIATPISYMLNLCRIFYLWNTVNHYILSLIL